jgi:alcohol dehydrogenase
MQALVYHGPGEKKWESVGDPGIESADDAIVKIDTTTICGTDLHILKGDVPTVDEGRTLGHEAVGTVVEVGSGVRSVEAGTRFLFRVYRRVAGARIASVGCTVSV